VGLRLGCETDRDDLLPPQRVSASLIGPQGGSGPPCALVDRRASEHALSVARVSIRTLGAFEVRLGNRSVPAGAWTQRRASDLVKILALADGHRVHRDRAIDALWPDLAPEAGAANLHKAAHYARKALDSADAVVLRESHLALWPTASIEVDSDVFQAAAEAALAAGDPGARRERAELSRGELPPQR